MGNRFFWIGAIVLVGLFIWGMSYVLTPEDGDAEFQKMLDATEQVKSFRGTYVGSTPSAQHAENLWEVDCNQAIVHKRSTELPVGANPVESTEDIFLVRSDQKFTRNSDGSWTQTKYTASQFSASWYCDNLAQGTLRDLLPDIGACSGTPRLERPTRKRSMASPAKTGSSLCTPPVRAREAQCASDCKIICPTR